VIPRSSKCTANQKLLFAIKIDYHCFVITGGTIKFHHLNKDRPHTQKEMQKMDRCRDYLKDNGVFDADSF
jgi:cell division protein FtsB